MFKKKLQTIDEYNMLKELAMLSIKGFNALQKKQKVPRDSLEVLELNNSSDEFQAINIGNNKFKLLPTSENINIFLYRGQNKYHKPCLSSFDRPDKSTNEKIINELKKIEFIEFIKTHPIINYLENLKILDCTFDTNYEELAQHYGFLTRHIDLTNDENIAMFFATTEYDLDNRCFKIIKSEENRIGILYTLMYDSIKSRVNIIGGQAIERPHMQRAFSINMYPSEDFNNIGSHKKDIKITTELSEKYFNMFDGGKKLMPDDSLTQKIYEIQDKQSISLKAVEIYLKETNKSLDNLKVILLENGYTITPQTVKFTKKELQKIKKDWYKKKEKIFLKSIKYHYS